MWVEESMDVFRLAVRLFHPDSLYDYFWREHALGTLVVIAMLFLWARMASSARTSFMVKGKSRVSIWLPRLTFVALIIAIWVFFFWQPDMPGLQNLP